LTFQVGNAAHVFIEPYGLNLDRALRENFPGQISVFPEEEAAYSRELGWSGWEGLQEAAVVALGNAALPQLLSMPAWKGVYLPVDVAPCSLSDIPGEDSPLAVGALDGLVVELENFGKIAGLPTDDVGLELLAEKYDDDDLCDDDMETQTYAQLLLVGHLAQRGRYPLWIVK